LSQNPDTESRGRVQLEIEQEVGANQEGNRKLTLSFQFLDEEHVDSVDREGWAKVSARLVDAVGTAQVTARQELVDQFAQALDELKIQFRRSARGEVVGLALSGLRSPLEESTARAILNALYGAQRGPLLPRESVQVGSRWTVEHPLAESTGFSGTVVQSYQYARKVGTVATLEAEGSVDAAGIDAARTMRAQTHSEYQLDLSRGWSQISVNSNVEVGERTSAQANIKQRVRLRWTREQPGAK
jgi:hypothetical protein